MTLTFYLDPIFFLVDEGPQIKDHRSLPIIVHKLQLHFPYLNDKRGKYSHMKYPRRFGQNYYKDPEGNQANW